MQKLNEKLKSDLKARAFAFGLNVISLCEELPSKKSVWIISDQLLRSSMSIGANIVEAKSASSRLDFKRYHEIALKSANETLYWLSILKMSKLAKPESVDPFIQEATELSRMLGKSVLSLKSRK